MKVLGIETATAVCSVALLENIGVSVERSISLKQMHSEKIMFLIDECLTSAKSDLRSIDGIAVSIGPGSFTGLRIGLSVAKGLAYSSGLKIVAVPTLEALAEKVVMQEEFKKVCIVMPLIDARRDEVYCAVYRLEGNGIAELHPPQSAFLDALCSLVPPGEDVIVVGDGAEKLKKYHEKSAFNKSSSYIFPTGPLSECSALPVAAIGIKKIASGISDAVSSLEPLYVKDFFTPARLEK